MNNSFKGLRHYIDIISEAAVVSGDGTPVTSGAGIPVTTGAPAAAPAGATASGSANPWEGKDPAKSAAWAKLSPEDQKWLGGADPTDTIILSRAPNKGAAVAAPAPAPTEPVAAPAADTTADNSGAPPAAATNFDSMPFGKAFQTAQAQGLKQFSWKGKPYAVKAKPAQAAKPTKPAPQMNNPGTMNPQGMDFSQMTGESVGYSEDQTLARIVELAKR